MWSRIASEQQARCEQVDKAGWQTEQQADETVAVSRVGPFELRAYRTCFTVTGPRAALTGPAPSLDDARHLAADALRRQLSGLSDRAIDGCSVAEIRAELDRLA